jgi:hypothetical protein
MEQNTVHDREDGGIRDFRVRGSGEEGKQGGSAGRFEV